MKQISKLSIKEKIEKELNNIYNFMSAEENQDYSFTMSEAEHRAKYLEAKLKELLKGVKK